MPAEVEQVGVDEVTTKLVPLCTTAMVGLAGAWSGVSGSVARPVWTLLTVTVDPSDSFLYDSVKVSQPPCRLFWQLSLPTVLDGVYAMTSAVPRALAAVIEFVVPVAAFGMTRTVLSVIARRVATVSPVLSA